MEDHAHVVLDQHDGQLLVVMQPADQLGDVVGFLVAHAGGRLVEQQQPRLERERHHDLGGALIAVRQFADEPVGLAGQARQRQQFVDARGDFAASSRATEPGPQAIARGDSRPRCAGSRAPSARERSR